jgi:hypothetical protein
MPTTTTRLALPYPVGTDPANVPGDMGNLANALDDGGSDPNFSGAAVFVDPPGVVGSLPAAPIKGTIYSVNSVPPYLLWYTGEATTPTGVAPLGWRLLGGVGTNTANISNSNPGNSVSAGTQPVWAALDHRHATPPWSSGQTTTINIGTAASDGSANAHARADHAHGVVVPAARIYQTVAQSCSPGTSNVINCTQDFTKGGFTTSGNTLVAPVTGIYRITGQTCLNISSVAVDLAHIFQFQVYVIVNGGLARAGSQSYPTLPSEVGPLTVSGFPKASVSDLVALNAGDVIAFQLNLTYVSALTTEAGSASTFLSAELVTV